MSEGKLILRTAFRQLEGELPQPARRSLRKLRHPDARWVRVPLGLFCIAGGIFSFLPILGIWMLPLGLLLIAHDVPFLRRPVGHATIWGMRKWASLRRRLQQKRQGP